MKRHHHDLNRCIHIHRSIIDTYRQDFGKYARKYQIKYLDVVFDQIPRLMGGKLVYSQVIRRIQIA